MTMDQIRRIKGREVMLGDRRAVGTIKRTRRANFWIKLIAICALILCLAVGLAFAVGGDGGKSGLWGKLCEFALGNGFIFGDKDLGQGEEISTEEDRAEDDRTEEATTVGEVDSDETEGEESSENETANESETGGENETISAVAADLSEVEKGDGYILNYSNRAYDTEGLLEMGFHAEYYPDSPSPMVLILHTHTSEGYAELDPDDPASVLTASVVAVGETLAAELNRAKIPTVHCSVIHDDDGDAYANAAETIETMMKIYPTIEYVIDLHRMTLTDADGNVVKTYSAEQTAQTRITVSTAGVLSRGTLSLALCLRRELNADGDRICMPIVLTDSEYNAAGSLYYLKLDVGSLGNSSDEARAAAVLFAEAFAEIIVG